MGEKRFCLALYGRYVPNGVKLQTIDGLVHRVGVTLLNVEKIRGNFWDAKIIEI